MNKVTLSLVALATLGGAAQVQAADLTHIAAAFGEKLKDS